jgi:acyl-CoA synthetase (AMP-forming)/AMP-acid ligase II
VNQAGNVSNVVELLERRSASIRGYRYLVDGEVAGARIEWTYAELDRRSRAVAARRERLGLRGQRALLLFPPGLDFAAAFFGAIYAGVVPVPVAPPDPMRLELTLPRLQAIARDARPAAILTVSAVRDLMEQLVTLAPELCVLETVAVDACPVRCEAANAWRPRDVSPHALAFLQYTSGSTGAPKGVMVSHANLLENARIIAHVVKHVSEERESVSWLPLFHDLALIGMLLLHLYMDRSITFMSPLDFLKRPMRWLEAISHFKAGLSGGPNFAYALVARKARPEEIAALDLSSWQLAFSGAETVRAAATPPFASLSGAEEPNPGDRDRAAIAGHPGLHLRRIPGAHRDVVTARAPPRARKPRLRADRQHLHRGVQRRTIPGSEAPELDGARLSAREDRNPRLLGWFDRPDRPDRPPVHPGRSAHRPSRHRRARRKTDSHQHTRRLCTR